MFSGFITAIVGMVVLNDTGLYVVALVWWYASFIVGFIAGKRDKQLTWPEMVIYGMFSPFVLLYFVGLFIAKPAKKLWVNRNKRY